MKITSGRKPAAVRMVDLNQPIEGFDDVGGYDSVRVFVRWGARLVGMLDIANEGHSVGAGRIRQAVAELLTTKLLPAFAGTSSASRDVSDLTRQYLAAAKLPPMTDLLPEDVTVSVVIATFDRPDDLRNCLAGLVVQVTRRRVEIVVVDNHPSSGLTPPVVAEFPSVKLVRESRQGLSYARNTGFAASSGAILITTDDDVVVPADWLEQLVAPFIRADIMVVAGNILPLELETPAQLAFELYGGLGRGFVREEYTAEWFAHFRRRAVPTWNIGATANAAFRAVIFEQPAIGLLDEALGAGTHTGCSEDTDLFYKVLKAGYTIVYEPSAFLWHRHRRDMRSLRKQIYSYSKGHVAYHLTTLLRDRDIRALHRLAVGLPRAHAWQLKRWARRRSAYPLSLIALEMVGNLAGPVALWRSRRAARRVGRSAPFLPPATPDAGQTAVPSPYT